MSSASQSSGAYNSTDAVLFPSFCMTIGVLVYYVLSRVPFLTQWLPYTAAMFLFGVAMGVGTTVLSHSSNPLNQSIQAWTDIDASVLLLVFLPGLIYKEIAVGLNIHLFRASLWQNIVFAFPLVLAGAALTALVAYYIFPYGWSFNLCMTMGSILSATDTVAVAVLMNQLGASPRLKVHVSGESLLNDGSVLVFYSIFVARFLFELGVDGVGQGEYISRIFWWWLSVQSERSHTLDDLRCWLGTRSQLILSKGTGWRRGGNILWICHSIFAVHSYKALYSRRERDGSGCHAWTRLRWLLLRRLCVGNERSSGYSRPRDRYQALWPRGNKRQKALG